MEVIYLAGGCLWGVQAFIKTIPGVKFTEAGRANGTSRILEGVSVASPAGRVTCF